MNCCKVNLLPLKVFQEKIFDEVNFQLAIDDPPSCRVVFAGERAGNFDNYAINYERFPAQNLLFFLNLFRNALL